MTNLTGVLNSTQVDVLVDKPVIMFKIVAIIFFIIFIVGVCYALWKSISS